MEEIIAGDFVLINKPDAGMVGLVHRVEAGSAQVWWHIKDVLGRAEVQEDSHPTDELKLFVGYVSSIPNSMIVLRTEKFPGKTLRIREPGSH